MIKILMADDHAIVREGLKQILADVPDMEIAGEAASGDDVLAMLRADNWDILLLDIAMPGKNVLELIKLAKQKNPQQPILILSMYPEDQYAIRMLKSGADGYLTKESAPDQLVAAIRKVAKGGKYISATMTDKLIEELNPDQNKLPHTKLSDREYQVFLAVAKGRRTSEIAQEMTLSVKTISTFRTRLMAKMHLHSTADIICYALKHGLLD
ncbi:response regulator [Methylovulum psychrotolerans]|jgi:DNA-binding NarL/FixJ family response regulator|uniref:DNA-binding response regulator n=1 Tax=Methylovulum psychrotolerans TaxID=1704499 RepID=A0A1Z4C257_9GAMM|nr:response regulator transcription factor [Methylovulum psychrotolerans]ASF47618.1 DNA-binding response regulator [Methylovulum psychrotolerans]POZ54072.1 DNA-binding response regulator [Methylovulum psychrotolerans]